MVLPGSLSQESSVTVSLIQASAFCAMMEDDKALCEFSYRSVDIDVLQFEQFEHGVHFHRMFRSRIRTLRTLLCLLAAMYDPVYFSTISGFVCVRGALMLVCTSFVFMEMFAGVANALCLREDSGQED